MPWRPGGKGVDLDRVFASSGCCTSSRRHSTSWCIFRGGCRQAGQLESSLIRTLSMKPVLSTDDTARWCLRDVHQWGWIWRFDLSIEDISVGTVWDCLTLRARNNDVGISQACGTSAWWQALCVVFSRANRPVRLHVLDGNTILFFFDTASLYALFDGGEEGALAEIGRLQGGVRRDGSIAIDWGANDVENLLGSVGFFFEPVVDELVNAQVAAVGLELLDFEKPARVSANG